MLGQKTLAFRPQMYKDIGTGLEKISMVVIKAATTPLASFSSGVAPKVAGRSKAYLPNLRKKSMTDAIELKNEILKIARAYQVTIINPLSLADLITQLGEDSKGPLNYALMLLMAEGKIGTRRAGKGLSIIWVS